MSSQNKSVGIFAKMLFVMLTVALVPMGLIWYASYRHESTQLERGVDARLAATAERLSLYTDQWLESHLRMLRLVAEHPDMTSMQGEKQKKLLVGIHDQYPYIYLAHTIRIEDGMNEGRSDGKEPLYYGDRAYLRDVLSARGYGLEAVVGKTSQLPAFILAVPILKDNRPVGVLSAALLIDDISKLIVDAAIGKTGFAFLLDNKGRVVAHPDKEFARVQKDMSQHPAFLAFKNDGKQPFQFKDASGKAIIAAAIGTREDMTLIAQQDVDEAYAPIKEANSQAGLVLLASTIVVAFLAFVFSRGFTSPIRRLTRATEALSMGEMSSDIPEGSRGDELGGLARAIERMGVSLQLAMGQLDSKTASPSGRPVPRNSMIVASASTVPQRESLAQLAERTRKTGAG